MIERKHLTEFGVNGIAVDYGHDFDTTTKASIVLQSSVSAILPSFRFTILRVLMYFSRPAPFRLAMASCATSAVRSRACPPAETRDHRANVD